jgi:circadian clock protein KaiC
MRSAGIDLGQWIERGLLRIHATRPGLYGLEMHLVQIHRRVGAFQPNAVVVDPISNLSTNGTIFDAEALLLRLIDFLKSSGITAMLINLTGGAASQEATDVGVSSLIDTWIVLRDIELGGERNRGLYVIKSRGMQHSNQIREFLITSEGIQLQDVYVGPEGVLTGSLRAAQEARERANTARHQQELQRKQRELAYRRSTLETQILALQQEAKAIEEEARIISSESMAQQRENERDRAAAAVRRGGDRVKD